MANIKFTDTIEVTASHGRLAKAAQIYDDQQKATQADLNLKFKQQQGQAQLTIFESGNKYSDIANEIKENYGGTEGYFFSNDVDWDIDGEHLPYGTLFYVYKTIEADYIDDETIFWDYIRVVGCNPTSLITRLEALEAKLKV